MLKVRELLLCGDPVGLCIARVNYPSERLRPYVVLSPEKVVLHSLLIVRQSLDVPEEFNWWKSTMLMHNFERIYKVSLSPEELLASALS